MPPVPSKPSTTAATRRGVASSPRGGAALRGSPRGAGAGGAAAHAHASLEAAAKNFQWDEDRQRMILETAEASSFCALMTEMGQSTIQLLGRRNELVYHVAKDTHETSGPAQTAFRADTTAALTTVSSELHELHDFVHGQILMQGTEERKRLVQLENENLLLRNNLEDAEVRIERYRCEAQSLQDTLSKRLVRTVLENEAIREDVRNEIKALNNHVDDVIAKLHQGVDSAVLKFNAKPQFESALRSLQDCIAIANERVADQAHQLHDVIDTIGVKDTVRDNEIKSIHSKLPAAYKRQLNGYTKEQLLNLLDVVSFEDGVVETVGKALYAINPERTQKVF